MPGFLLVDTVHQGDRDGVKGVYIVNLVDEVTQYEYVGVVRGISERFLIPALEALLLLFPFPVIGFHADNGSEYINHRVANLLQKLHVGEFTKSRARRSNDNACGNCQPLLAPTTAVTADPCQKGTLAAGASRVRVVQRYVSLKRSVWTIIRRMIVTLQTERLQTVEQIRGFLDGNGEVDFRPLDRDEAYGFVRRTLVRLDYDALGRAGKGTVREFLGKATGLSRAQVTRLIGQYRATGRVEDRRAANSGRSFERVYTPADIRLLAEADEIGGQLCGPAACEVLRRQYEGSAMRASSGCRGCPRRTCTTCAGRRLTARGGRPSTTRGRPRCASASVGGRTPPASPATCVWTRSTRATATA